MASTGFLSACLSLEGEQNVVGGKYIANSGNLEICVKSPVQQKIGSFGFKNGVDSVSSGSQLTTILQIRF